jgi:hypothetical protein
MPARSVFVIAAAFWIAGGLKVCAEDRLKELFHYDLLEYPTVQKELALSAEKSAEISALVKTYEQTWWKDAVGDGSWPDLRNATDGERYRKVHEINEALSLRSQIVRARFAPRFERLLNPHQRVRLLQIDWQLEWRNHDGRTFIDLDLAKAIGLSQQQCAQLAALYARYQDQEEYLLCSRGVETGSPELPKAIAELRRLYSDWSQSMTRVVTEGQMRKLDIVLGKPIDLPRLLKEMRKKENQIRRVGR